MKDYRITGEFAYETDKYTVQVHASGDLKILEMVVKLNAGTNGVRLHCLSKAYTTHSLEHDSKFYYHIRRMED